MSVSLEIKGSGKGAVDLVVALNKELDKTEKTGKKAGDGFAKLKVEAEKFAASGDKVEQLRLKIGKLGEYVEKGVLSQEKANQAAARWRAQLEQTNPKVREAEERQRQYAAMAERTAQRQKQLATEAERAAEAQKRMGDRLRMDVETPLEKHKRQLLEVGRAYRSGVIDKETFIRHSRQLKKELESTNVVMAQTAMAGRQAFGPEFAGFVQNIATRVLAVAGATQVATHALQELKKERDEAKNELESSVTGRGLTTQLAATADDPEAEQKRLTRQAERIFAMGATTRLDAAHRLNFDLVSGGLSEKDIMFAARAKAAEVLEDPASTAQAFAGLERAFAGGDKIGSFEAIVSKGLAASKNAPASADEILREAGKAGSAANALGFTDEFLISAIAEASVPAGGIGEGGTQIRSLLRGLEKNGANVDPSLKGLSGLETIKTLASRNYTRAQLKEVLGDDSEAISGFRSLANNLDRLEETEKLVTSGNQRSLGEESIQRNLADYRIGSVVSKRQSENARMLHSMKDAAAATQADAIMANRELVERRTAPGFLTEAIIGTGRFNRATHDFFGGSGQSALEHVLGDGMRVDRGQRELAEEILRELKGIREANEKKAVDERRYDVRLEAAIRSHYRRPE